ncbi:hypothetical protein SAY86_006095 [Trapa natans]|uniref:B box-type domain-containing protein n=1 Tax=Trapa natans TaxID=22666 RepID=A0AAN7LD12_TRANT|nr:hypothetical protein SAY86_006095 [Trapa natans]
MEGKRGCELCGRPARMYCESDQASLCWGCDERVHCANFLVAKHTRRLLCQVCLSPTPWAAAGPKLGTTVSVCDGCFESHGRDPEVDLRVVKEGRRDVDEGYSVNEVASDGDGEDNDQKAEDDNEEDQLEGEASMEDDDDDDEYDDDEEEDGENQVVPWSFDSPPPPAASSSSSGEGSPAFARGRGVGCTGLGPKRVWDIAFINDSDDEIGCVSSQGTSRPFASTEEGPSGASLRPTKQQRFGESNTSSLFHGEVSKPASAVIRDSLKRLQNNAVSEDGSAATVLGICRMSRC